MITTSHIDAVWYIILFPNHKPFIFETISFCRLAKLLSQMHIEFRSN